MATDPVLRLERWGVPYGYEERSWPASEEELHTIIQTLDKESSAILALELGDDWLTISASEGRFSVMVRFGEDSPFDLVGDAAVTGSEPFVLGGQEVPHPRRYLVNRTQAQDAALEFLRTGTVDTERGNWQQQGPNSAWMEV